MVAGAIDWNICPEVLRMTKGSIARGHNKYKYDHSPYCLSTGTSIKKCGVKLVL